MSKLTNTDKIIEQLITAFLKCYTNYTAPIIYTAATVKRQAYATPASVRKAFERLEAKGVIEQFIKLDPRTQEQKVYVRLVGEVQ